NSPSIRFTPMQIRILVLLTFLSTAVSAQNVLDSIKLYDYPVREGVIYKYERNSNFISNCANSLSIVSVVTPSDSVFHFEGGTVSGVYPVDDFYVVSVMNAKSESVTYSNLKQVNVKKGDNVLRGMCVGTSA